MKKTMIYIAIAAIASVTFAGCGSKKTAVSVTDQKEMPKQTGMQAEVAITFPCSGMDSGLNYLHVNGQGRSKDRTMAKDEAYLDAVANLSSKLAGVAARGANRVAVSNNDEGLEQFHAKVVVKTKEIAQADVAGYRVSCEEYTVLDGAYTCYVSLEFGKDKLVKQLYESLSNDKLLRIDYDFDRYMKEFNDDLKDYEYERARK